MNNVDAAEYFVSCSGRMIETIRASHLCEALVISDFEIRFLLLAVKHPFYTKFVG
jgi:hypothetical protein